MKIKLVFGAIFLLLFSFSNLFGQDDVEYKEKYYTPDPQNFEQFIQEAYADRAEDLVFNNEIKRLILLDYFTNRLTIVDRHPDIEIPEWFQDLNSLGQLGYAQAPSVGNSFNPKEFNPFFYNIHFVETKDIQNIRITGTHFYLSIKPFDPEVINQLRQE